MENSLSSDKTLKKNCDWCKTEINLKAIICPHCGKEPMAIYTLRKKVKASAFGLLGWLVAIFVGLFAIGYIFEGTGNTGVIIYIIFSIIIIIGIFKEIKRGLRTKKELDNLINKISE